MEHQNARAGPSKPRKQNQQKNVQKQPKLSKAKLEAKSVEDLDELALSYVRESSVWSRRN